MPQFDPTNNPYRKHRTSEAHSANPLTHEKGKVVKMGESPKVSVQDSFSMQVAVVCLLALVFLEAASLFGFFATFTSIFLFPGNTVLSALIVMFGLLGVYGILKASHSGKYFSLLTPTMELAMLAIYLVGTFSAREVSWTIMLRGFPVGFVGIACIFSIAKVLNYPTTAPKATSAPGRVGTPSHDWAVELVNVTKRYMAGTVVVPAVNGLTMKVKRGEFVAVMGPSGCGKSTLLNLIGALDRPTSGQILIDGVEISELGELGLAQMRNEKVGFVFQAYNLINRSNVVRNVELPMLVKGISKEQRIKKIDTMLSVVGLGGMALRKPRMLSGGEQQRVAIARALVNSPKIVLADEPTGNLDSKAGSEILSFLKNMNQGTGTTVIMVTHNREAAEMAHRIIYLKDGRIEKEEIRRS